MDIDRDVLQAKIDAAKAGVVEIQAGTYVLRDSLRLRDGIIIRGQAGTVLRIAPTAGSAVTQILGYGHREFRVAEPNLFRVGMGVHIRDDQAGGFHETIATIIERSGDTFFIDRPFNCDYLPTRNARVTAAFPLVAGYGVRDAAIENVILDGVDCPFIVGGCRSGGVYLIGCQRVRIENVEVRNYGGDAVSFQQCADVIVRRCHLHDNARSGVHPGSGSVRYVIDQNRIHGNGGFGVFYCLRTTHSICRQNDIRDNGSDGINLGERDTDHLIESNTIEANGGAGIAWRNPGNESGERTILRGNTIGSNCKKDSKAELFLPPGIRDVAIVGNTITPGNHPAMFAGEGCERMSAWNNTIAPGRAMRSDDITGDASCVRAVAPQAFPSVGPEALSLDGARHLGIKQLERWQDI